VNLLCTLLGLTCLNGTLTGNAFVYDGDTIYVNHEPVRLAGIDITQITLAKSFVPLTQSKPKQMLQTSKGEYQ
jgi:endonuclease YncB( thermonuclease family)